jgi:hypothetical protein
METHMITQNTERAEITERMENQEVEISNLYEDFPALE